MQEPAALCAIELNGIVAQCSNPLAVEFGVPFQIKLDLTLHAFGGARYSTYGRWELTAVPAVESFNAPLLKQGGGVYQNGQLVATAMLAEVPEPVTAVLFGGSLALLGFVKRKA